MASPNDKLYCKVCKKDTDLKKCAKCQETTYCSATCQKQDWPAHKISCGKPWWSDVEYTKQQDGSFHEGKLELVTWPDKSGEMGWGAIIKDEVDDMKKKFETEMGGDEKKLFEYWPQAFRWTCCGVSAEMNWGCDHHGTGRKPCSCDFCKMGKPLTESIYNERCESQHGKGLRLSRGPDPRSFNAASAGINAAARAMLGMDS